MSRGQLWCLGHVLCLALSLGTLLLKVLNYSRTKRKRKKKKNLRLELAQCVAKMKERFLFLFRYMSDYRKRHELDFFVANTSKKASTQVRIESFSRI